MNLNQIRQSYERKIGHKEQINKDLEELNKDISFLKKEIKYSEEAQIIIQKVAQETQSELKFYISDMVSTALDAIFDDPYKLNVDFVIKRNKTEVDITFERGGNKTNPINSSGGGAVDIAAFALRIALWNLETPKSRNIFIIDEPFKNLSKSLIPRAGELLKELSSKLNLQMIIITHIDELTNCADKIFNVTQRKGVSQIENI